MPELPEVETIVRSLAPRLKGRLILNAEFRCARVLRGDAETASARLAGARIGAVRRHGKFIVFELDRGANLIVHLGMTGKLLLDAAAEPGRHTHAIFTLDQGSLLYDDIRQFGRLEVKEGRGLPERAAALGPDPLEIGADEFLERLRGRATKIKPLLLNQAFLRGLGNIYCDEALFRARIHPRAVASRLSRERARRLLGAIVETLEESIAGRGSSISDYVDADGERGSFQLRHRVYQKDGEPCVVCGTPIRRILLAQRGTHFCPRCQRS